MHKEKKSAAELGKMVQEAVDPKGEWVRIAVWPKPAPHTTWVVTASGSIPRADLLDAAHRKAEELSNLYEIDEDSA